jgi:hypothetical protein
MPTRSERRSAVLIFRNLEERIRQGQKIPAEQFDAVKMFLNSGKFSREEITRLKEIKRLAEMLEHGTRQPKTYSGMCGTIPLTFSFSDSVTILRPYGTRKTHHLKIIWEFDYTGMIKQARAELIPEKKEQSILLAESLTGSIVQCTCYEMPDRTRLLNPYFATLKKAAQYGALIRYGHGTAKDFVNSSPEDITDAFWPEAGHYPLRELKKNISALEILASISRGKPNFFFERTDEKKGRLIYPA